MHYNNCEFSIHSSAFTNDSNSLQNNLKHPLVFFICIPYVPPPTLSDNVWLEEKTEYQRWILVNTFHMTDQSLPCFDGRKLKKNPARHNRKTHSAQSAVGNFSSYIDDKNR